MWTAMKNLRAARGAAAICVGAVVLSLPMAAAAQETRTEEIARRQAAKAASLAPYEPNRFERIMGSIETAFADPPSGFFPAVGRVYAGGGFSLGGGYRHYVGRKSVWDATGLYSVKNYKLIEFAARTPWNLEGRWTLAARAGWLDAPQVGYFGLGPDSGTADRTNFGLSQGYVEGTATFRPTRWTRLAGEIALDDYSTDEGRGRFPSIETRYSADAAPGLGASPTYLRTEATAAIDWRRSPGYSRTGGYYGISLVNYADLDDTHGFQRLNSEVIQHVPILRETWVISLRGRLETTLDADDVVPYFLLPQLGSGRTLRAYSTGRFRDRHALLTTAEFRWIPSRLALDMALFFDAGKVAARRADLDFTAMKSNWGIGARFHGPTATVLRIEAARGSDGWNLVVATSAAF